MLPPGHVAGGFLVVKALLKRAPADVSEKERKMLVWWGTLLAFLPDVDTFYAFFKSSSFTINSAVADHRVYLTHTPILWLIAGLLIFLLAKKPFYKYFGLLVWVAPWLHFILDSIDHGVRWLWPFSQKLLAFLSGTSGSVADTSGFFPYWMHFLLSYSHSATFYIEISIIIVALMVFFRPFFKAPQLDSGVK